MPTETLTLYNVEENLQSLLDTEALVDPEQEAQFKAELAESLKYAVEKRDRIAQCLLTWEHKRGAIAAEMARLKALDATYKRAEARLEKYVVGVIEGLGKDAGGKYRKLAGETAVLSVKQNPPSTVFTDEAAVPSEFKTLTITVPAQAWEHHIEVYDYLRAQSGYLPAFNGPAAILTAINKTEVSIDKRAVKAAIEAGETVPGADVKFGELSLQVK
jgi:hypothetical protein